MVSLNQIIEKLSHSYEIVVGFPKDKQVVYPPDDRKHRHSSGGQTVAQVARIQEFGAKGHFWGELNQTIDIPARPFLADTLKENKKEIRKLIADSFLPKNIVNDKRYEKIGERIREMVIEKMKAGPWVPNSPRTIALKKSSRPLIDRGIMIRNVKYEVRRA